MTIRRIIQATLVVVGVGAAQALASQTTRTWAESLARTAFPTWNYDERIDEITDAKRPSISTLSERPMYRRGSPIYGTLSWRCDEDGLNVVLSLGTYFGGDSDNQVQVQYRIDADPAVDPQWWVQSTCRR